MRVFVTGASGWIGGSAVEHLLAADHQVVGLARSDASAAKLAAQGAGVLRGDLDDLDSLRTGAEHADAVLHLANKHDFVNPGVSDRAERAAVQTLCETLAGSGRTFLLAGGMAGMSSGRPVAEQDASPAVGPDSPRGGSENLALSFVEQGVSAVSVRFAPTVHGHGDSGFIPAIIQAARQRGVSGYIGEGANRWAAVHLSDAGRLCLLGLDVPAGTRLHAAAEEGVPTRQIAEAIGAGLGLPVAPIDAAEAIDQLGFIGRVFGMEMSGLSAATRELTGWTPTGPTLLEDLAPGSPYFS